MTDPQRFQVAYRIYHELSDLAPGLRESRLQELATEDPALAEEVRRLLQVADGTNTSFLAPLSSPRQTHGDEDLSGQQLGEFELLEVLGRGGMGTVYRAVQHPLGRIVAVKVMRGHVTLEDIRGVGKMERFVREAVLPAAQPHPGLVPILRFGQDQGRAFYAMELVDGWDLAQLRRDPPDDAPIDLSKPDVIARFIASVADALQHCHEQGIVHRDVKPQNILVDRTGQPRVVDFGIAIEIGADRLTRTGEKPGTPLYMSPEQAESWKRQVDHRTDVYSLGAVLYELLTGQPPFVGQTEGEILERISRDPLKPVREIAPETPVALQRICETALCRDPADRYVSAGRMAEDLQRFARGEVVHPPSPSLARRAIRAARHHRRSFLAGGVLLLGAASYANWRRAYALERCRLEITTTKPGRVFVHRFVHEYQYELVDEFQLDDESAVWLEPGSYRLHLKLADHSSVSTTRVCRRGTVDQVHFKPNRTAELASSMVSIRGGTLALNVPLNSTTGHPPERKLVVQDFGAFLMDARPVTNEEYLTYLRQAGIPDGEIKAWRYLVTKPRIAEDEWKQLPATSVPVHHALAFAESRGKTLPTAWEWAWAIQGGPTCEWIHDRDWGRGSEDASKATAPPQGTDYQHVRPVDFEVRPGLYYDLGNAAELTADFLPSSANHGWDSPYVLTGGRGPNHDPRLIQQEGVLRWPGFIHLSDRFPHITFRCIQRIPSEPESAR